MMPRPPGTKETREKKSPTPKPTITRPRRQRMLTRRGRPAHRMPLVSTQSNVIQAVGDEHAATCARAGTRCRDRGCAGSARSGPGAACDSARIGAAAGAPAVPIAEERQAPQPAAAARGPAHRSARRRRRTSATDAATSAGPESCWRMTSEMKPPRMKKSSVKLVRKVWTREISTARPEGDAVL